MQNHAARTTNAAAHNIRNPAALNPSSNRPRINGPSAFMDSIQLNLFHYYTVVHHALPELKQNQGAIVNVGSHVADTGQGGTSGYVCSSACNSFSSSSLGRNMTGLLKL